MAVSPEARPESSAACPTSPLLRPPPGPLLTPAHPPCPSHLIFCDPPAGCDLFRALELPSASAPGQRLFGWHRRGRRVAYEVARALAWMHSRGVAHMDVSAGMGSAYYWKLIIGFRRAGCELGAAPGGCVQSTCAPPLQLRLTSPSAPSPPHPIPQVKSSNILLTSSGTAKLCDLALSLALAAPAEGAPLGAGAGTLPDVSGDATGTWAWAAPEVLASGVGCSLAADIHRWAREGGTEAGVRTLRVLCVLCMAPVPWHRAVS